MKIYRYLLISLLLQLFLGAASLAGGSERGLIIGGERIGPAMLGMTMEEINKTKETSPCPVNEVIFSGEGRAVELRTAWGGLCATPEGMMASTYGVRVLQMLLGEPDEIKPENSFYKHITTYWWYYYKRGLSFRVIYTEDGHSLIQMVAVFQKE